jgi:hypothetical protein
VFSSFPSPQRNSESRHRWGIPPDMDVGLWAFCFMQYMYIGLSYTTCSGVWAFPLHAAFVLREHITVQSN